MTNKKKLLITGTSGMLGGNLVHQLSNKYDIYGADKGPPNSELKKQFNIDITDSQKVLEIVEQVKPDYFVHCAAITDVDLCEENYPLARNTHALSTKNILAYLNPDTRFIYISTDSVFDGKHGNYTETDLPSPLNNYAKTKLEGEWFVEQMSINYVIIRTNFFGKNLVQGRSLAEWVVEMLEKKIPINMFTDVIFSPVFVNTLSEYIEKLLNLDYIGRINIGCDGSISKYNFGVLIANIFNLDSSLITPSAVDAFDFKAKRPKNTSLNISKAKSLFTSMTTIEENIIKFYNIKNMRSVNE